MREIVLCATLVMTVAGAASAEESGFVADWTADFDRASERLLQLAGEIPAEKFSWRPSPGVRSVSEVYMHVASNNFYYARDVGGVALPADFPDDAEKEIVGKEEVLAALRRSQDNLRLAVKKVASDPDEEVELFGRSRTLRSIFLFVLAHSHEHLGQSIAYARSLEVVPPWSRPR